MYEFVKNTQIDLIVVGPEAPLANGIVDYFLVRNIKIIGPTQAAARIESSKIFARELMAKAKIPQPEFVICANREATNVAIAKFGLPVVIKVDGLAEGKGAFVCHQSAEVETACQTIYEDKKFGQTKVLVEECLSGQEMSVFALCDVSDYKIIGTAQDYKRLLDNNKGPNTGGMGAISPSPLAKPEIMEKIKKKIIEPTLKAMNQADSPFAGFLYCGLMIKDNEPRVIEFNCRLGDPETQVILPLIKGDFFDLLWLAANHEIYQANFSLSDYSTAFVFKVAKGYPGLYVKGNLIKVPSLPNNRIIHAGTKINEVGELVTNGGRVAGALGLSPNPSAAIKDAYVLLHQIHFENEFYRRDIGR
ncbi:MAG: phosphoribosylamine--glycine ligase [Candidatus Falkowbacteria bacterium]|nr:phosphoribosylamine--glycine ligase [Candidatus Falkowbacteria bacterium]